MEEQEIKPPIGDFIIENATGVMGADGKKNFDFNVTSQPNERGLYAITWDV